MSMLTRCPNCETSFRITTDQLVSRQGKVRCGNCQQVFSALGSLVHTRETAAHPLSMPAPAPVAEPAPAANSVPGEVEELVDAESAEAYAEAEAEADETDESGDAAQFAAPEPPRVSWRRKVEQADDETEEPARGRRIAWLSLIGVLAATTALAAQAAYFYRDQLAVLEPGAKPWLVKMCAQLKCKVQTPADPQAIGIESSGLEADPTDKTRIQLTALLRNRSALEQNLPYLELTLLDTQDTPLVRRVFAPDDYAGRSPAPLAPDSEYQVKLTIDAGQIKANGYRLYAFYP